MSRIRIIFERRRARGILSMGLGGSRLIIRLGIMSIFP